MTFLALMAMKMPKLKLDLSTRCRLRRLKPCSNALYSMAAELRKIDDVLKRMDDQFTSLISYKRVM